MLIAKKFDIFESLSKYFNIYSKIIFRDAEIFLHQAELFLRHQMRVSNYFVKFFNSVIVQSVLLVVQQTIPFTHFII